jgi:predicted lipase
VGGFGFVQEATTGFTGYSERDKAVIVVFRGTNSDEGWSRNFKASLTELPSMENGLCPTGAKIHSGFFEESSSFRKTFLGKTSLLNQEWYKQMYQAVRQCSEANDHRPCEKLIFVGHSLGGSLATLAAMNVREGSERMLRSMRYVVAAQDEEDSLALKKWELLNHHHTTEGLLDGNGGDKRTNYRRFAWLPKRLELVTFGAPRVGDKSFVKCFKGMDINSKRFVYDADIVPHLPPRFSGFRHLPGEIWTQRGKTYFCPLELNQYESKRCANSVPVRKYNKADHSKSLNLKSESSMFELKSCGTYDNTRVVPIIEKKGFLGGYKSRKPSKYKPKKRNYIKTRKFEI